MSNEALIFELEDIRFGIWAADIRQVLRAVAISTQPDAPPWIEGIIDIHGRIVPVVDLRQLLRLPAKELGITDHLLVVAKRERQIAIRVDRALDVIPLDVETIEQTDVKLAGAEFKGNIAKTAFGLIHILEIDDLMSAIGTTMPAGGLMHQSGGVG